MSQIRRDHLLRLVVAPLVFAMLAIGVASSANAASVTYSYAGQPYSPNAPTFCNGTYTATCTQLAVTGFFTVATAFAPNLSNYAFTPLQFSFSDGSGVFSLTSGDVLAISTFQVSTDASGNIVGWDISLATNATDCTTPPSGSFECIGSYHNVGGQSGDFSAYAFDLNTPSQVFGAGQNSDTPGQWSAPGTTCLTTTLANLQASGGCVIGDKSFFNFFLSEINGVSVPASDVTVTPISSEPFGFTFGLQTSPSSGTTELAINFQGSTVTGANTIDDLELNTSGISGPSTGAVENACIGPGNIITGFLPSGIPTCTLTPTGLALVTGYGQGSSALDTFSPSSAVYVSTGFILNNGVPISLTEQISQLTSSPPTSESITQLLSPTAPNQFQFDNNVHNFTVQYPAGTNFSGVNMTVTAQQTPAGIFQARVAGTPFANAVCIAYQGEGGYCEDYQVSCTDMSGDSISCPSESTPTISVKTSYNTTQTILNPGFLTTPLGTDDWTNIFDSFYLQRIDPTTKGRTTGFSEFVAVSLGVTNAEGEGTFAFLPPLQQADDRIFPQGIPIPVEFQLMSLTHPGTPVTDATAGITVTMISDASGNPTSAIVLEESSAFRYLGGRYVYLLNTEHYAPGVYNLTVYGNAFPAQQVQFTLPSPTQGGKLKTTLQSLTFDISANQYLAVLNVTNSGSVETNGVVVTLSALNFTPTSTVLPYSLGDINPGASATVTLSYSAAAGRQGSLAVLTVFEAFAGGFAPALIPAKLPDTEREDVR
jgi:hypothetical protein